MSAGTITEQDFLLFYILQAVAHFSINSRLQLREIVQIETIAIGRRIRELPRPWRDYGIGRWRKHKGIATVRLFDNSIHLAEVHWYEAHGIGRKEIKAKRLIS